MKDEGSNTYNNCNPYFNRCYGGYYIGSTAPTTQSQFTIPYELGFTDQDWHRFPVTGTYASGVSGSTVYVAFLWRNSAGLPDGEGPPPMAFDCLSVNIEDNSQ